jgi:hypothetical protein
LLWRRRFIINEPNAIRHVLLDNPANYTKSELSRRLLEPALGHGRLTSEGETWRRHRRIMAPAFDHRSIIGYAPIITEVTAGLLEQWDALADSTETTLHIISRAMFSSDSNDIVDVVARGVGLIRRPCGPASSICYDSRCGSRGCFRSDAPLEPSTSSTSQSNVCLAPVAVNRTRSQRIWTYGSRTRPMARYGLNDAQGRWCTVPV